MHSSRMRTGRSLAVFGGVYLVPGGVPGPGGCTWSREGVPGRGEGYLVQGVCVCTWQTPPLGPGTPPGTRYTPLGPDQVHPPPPL